jgi:hypothetical protein
MLREIIAQPGQKFLVGGAFRMFAVGCTAAPCAPGCLHTNIKGGHTVQFEWTAGVFTGTTNGPIADIVEAG